MKTINKNPISPASVAIANLLDKHWVNADNMYTSLPSYDDITATMREHFANEQDNLCCYCMRKISTSNKTVTLEHIIPQSADITLAAKYQSASPLLANWVVYKSLFNRSLRIDAPPDMPFSSAAPQPHHIAYYNLIAACNESRTCNNGRRNEYVAPFLYDTHAVAQLRYTKEGVLSGYKLETGETKPIFEGIEALKLSNPQIWNFIREVWYELSRKFSNANEIDEKDIDAAIGVVQSSKPTKQATHLKNNFKIGTEFRAKIPLFSYFFYYYRQHYPLCPSTT